MPRSNLERDANRACFFIPDWRGGYPLAPRHGWDSYAPPVVARIGDRGWHRGVGYGQGRAGLTLYVRSFSSPMEAVPGRFQNTEPPATNPNS
jgi:hypothetical protein